MHVANSALPKPSLEQQLNPRRRQPDVLVLESESSQSPLQQPQPSVDKPSSSLIFLPYPSDYALSGNSPITNKPLTISSGSSPFGILSNQTNGGQAQVSTHTSPVASGAMPVHINTSPYVPKQLFNLSNSVQYSNQLCASSNSNTLVIPVGQSDSEIHYQEVVQ